MKDQTTGLPLRVSPDAIGPYIRLPYSQIEALKNALDSRGIAYRVQEEIVSLNGGPFIAVVNLGRKANADAIQEILDSVP